MWPTGSSRTFVPQTGLDSFLSQSHFSTPLALFPGNVSCYITFTWNPFSEYPFKKPDKIFSKCEIYLLKCPNSLSKWPIWDLAKSFQVHIFLFLSIAIIFSSFSQQQMPTCFMAYYIYNIITIIIVSEFICILKMLLTSLGHSCFACKMGTL